ncbi:MAG: hypothetical protein ABR992_16050 [Solirubrobacteraceae bacterium]|jgi:hypothetical protein
MLVSPVGSASNIQMTQPSQPPRPQMTEVAKLLGLSTSELSSELQAGKTLDELASKKGVSSSELIKTIEGELTAHKPEGAPALSSTQLTEMATSIAAGTPPSPPSGGPGGLGGTGGVAGAGSSTSGSQSSLSTLAESLGIEPSVLLKELANGAGTSSLLESSGYTGDGSSSQQSYAGGVTFDEYA